MRIQFQRLPSVIAATGICRSGVYKGINDGTLPLPIKIGARAIGFLSYEIDAVSEARIAGASNDKLRELVKALHAKRGTSPCAVEISSITLQAVK
jgi:prophage regulatory protein